MKGKLPNLVLVNLSKGTPKSVQPKDGDIVALVQTTAAGQMRQVYFPKEHFTALSPREWTDLAACESRQGLMLLGAARYTKVGGTADLNIAIKDMHGNPTVPAEWKAIHVQAQDDTTERPDHFDGTTPAGIV